MPGSGTEAEAVARLFEAKPILATEATEARFKQESPHSRLLHVATHGFTEGRERTKFNDHPFSIKDRGNGALADSFRNPLLNCGLVFAGANKGGTGKDDGVLTAYEVLELNLSGTELAVLSACETGLGEATSTEGVLGLRRAFRVAGARNLVTSLWTIDDKATLEFMTTFYKLLATDADSSRVLTLTQRAMIKEGIGTATWSAFVHIGPFSDSDR